MGLVFKSGGRGASIFEFSTRKKIVNEVSIVDYHTGAVVLDAIVNQDEEAILQARKRPRALDGEDSVEDYDQRLVELRHRRAIYKWWSSSQNRITRCAFNRQDHSRKQD